MTPSEFVNALKIECRDAAVEDCVKNFTSPAGRSPSKHLMELSAWFNLLNETERKMVIRAMTSAADATLFGVLAILDGARTIENQGEKSVFHLTAHKGGKQSVICPGPYDLHDL